MSEQKSPQEILNERMNKRWDDGEDIVAIRDAINARFHPDYADEPIGDEVLDQILIMIEREG